MLSINVGDDKIKIVDGKSSGGKIVVNKCYEIETKVGAMESGNIKDLMAFSQVLQECITSGAIKNTTLTYVLDNPRVIFREMNVPSVSQDKVKLIVANEIFSDSKMANNTLDYIVEGTFKNEEGKKRSRITVTYVSNDAIDSLHTAAMELGMRPSVLDVAPNSISKLIEKFYRTNKRVLEKTFVLLDYKDSFISLYVFDDGQRKFYKSSTLYVGNVKDNKYLLGEMTSNVNSVIRFYESRSGVNVSAIYITGNVEGLDDELLQGLAESLNMMISHLPIPSFVKGVDIYDFNKFSGAIGAFLRR
ncbi:MAG: pilus assembly protein PilM [Clostridia bacterium]|nr:pilus assembly protein PilM [Clostridia bacterium]